VGVTKVRPPRRPAASRVRGLILRGPGHISLGWRIHDRFMSVIAKFTYDVKPGRMRDYLAKVELWTEFVL